MPHEAKAGDSVVRWGKGHVVILKRMERFGGGVGFPTACVHVVGLTCTIRNIQEGHLPLHRLDHYMTEARTSQTQSELFSIH